MAHICLVCNAPATYFFEKNYIAYPNWPFGDGFTAKYYKCSSCGFTFSDTHQTMEQSIWGDLNSTWHHAFESGALGENINQPPYANMALATKLLSVNGLVNTRNALDYAAGYGTFSGILGKYFDERIYRYDPFVSGQLDEYCIDSVAGKKYDFVVNTAMFEHILYRRDIDAVNDLVSDAGVMMLHTQIRQEIPCDPNWFYLEPHVHSAFFTNKSMEILLDQWGYKCSVYSPEARVWFFFKSAHPMIDSVPDVVREINRELQREYFFYKVGFMDYWK